jgi:hypothetical protein
MMGHPATQKCGIQGHKRSKKPALSIILEDEVAHPTIHPDRNKPDDARALLTKDIQEQDNTVGQTTIELLRIRRPTTPRTDAGLIHVSCLVEKCVSACMEWVSLAIACHQSL